MLKNEIRVLRDSTDVTKMCLISKMNNSNLIEKVRLLLFYQNRLDAKKQEVHEFISKKTNNSNSPDTLFSNLKKVISGKLNLDSYLSDESIDKLLKSKIQSYIINTEIFNKSYNNYEIQFFRNKQNSIIELNINDNSNFLKNDFPHTSYSSLNKLIIKKTRYITERCHNPNKECKQWNIKKNDLKEVLISDKKNSAFIYFEITKWRIKNNIPAQVFVKVENKENNLPFYQYINLETPIFVILFQEIIKNTNEILTLEEYQK